MGKKVLFKKLSYFIGFGVRDAVDTIRAKHYAPFNSTCALRTTPEVPKLASVITLTSHKPPNDPYLQRWQVLRSGSRGVSRGLIVESRNILDLADEAWFPSNLRIWEPTSGDSLPTEFDVVVLKDLRWQRLEDDGFTKSERPAIALSLLRSATQAVRKGKPILAHSTQRFTELKKPAQTQISPFDLDASRLLALEELAYLLQSHCELPAPDIDPNATATYLTPIERRLAQALTKAEIPFQVQVPIDHFVVDFLIDDHLVVECDGESWHDPANDERRDARLHELNFKVVRFTGRAIVRDSEYCVSRIHEERTTTRLRPRSEILQMTPAQRNAASHLDGPAIVVAPAGSGKTRVIEERVRLLIASGVEPSRICVVSFTNAAVNEVKDRLLAHPEVVCQTLNKFASDIVRGARGVLTVIENHRDPRIPTPLQILKEVSPSVGYNPQPILGMWTILREAISNYRGSFILPGLGELGIVLQSLQGENEDALHNRCVKMFLKIHSAYEKTLRERSFIDFNGQVIEAIRILTRDQMRRLEISQRYDYWLIDEFQDLSPPKILLSRLLASPSRNLMVVGDDDQIIYGFAGAQPQSFSSLDRDWCDVTSLPLDKNFRSPHELVVRTRWLIERNKKRIPKDTTPVREIDDKDCVFTSHYRELRDEHGQRTQFIDYATSAVDEYERLRKSRPSSDIVFLFRVSMAAAPVELLLDMRKIPYVPLAKTSLLTNRVAKWTFAWLRVINLPLASPDDWDLVVRLPPRYLTNATIKWITSAADSFQRITEAIETHCEQVPGLTEKQSPKMVLDSLIALKQTIEAARRFPNNLGDQLRQLDLQETLASDERKRLEERDSPNAKHQGDGRSADPKTVYDIVALMAELAGTWNALSAFLERADEDKDINLDIPNPRATSSDALELLTIHRFKGRERSIVFVLGPPQGCMPDSRARTVDELEEERRVAYVSATRAKERLYFWCSELYENELSNKDDGLTWNMYRQGLRVPPTTNRPTELTANHRQNAPRAVTERQPGLLESALKWIASWFK